MRIFVTGAPGFIGSELVPELIQAGHSVLGLTRSDLGAEKLRASGAEVLHGNIEDLDSLRKGAADSDGVIHLAFNHDFSQFEKNAADDRKAITAMGEVLLGSDRPFVVTSGTAIAANVDGKPSTENGPTAAWNPRAASEATVKELTARGVNSFRGAAAAGSRHMQARASILPARRGAREACSFQELYPNYRTGAGGRSTCL